MRKHFGILTLLAAMIAAIFVPFCGVSVAASGDNEVAIGDYYYTFANGEAALYGCVKSVSGNITLPANVDYQGKNYPITKIRTSAFYGQKITSVKISKNIKEIGESSFMNCTSLTTVTFDNNTVLTTIGRNAFESDTALTSITLPNSVTTIGDNAFWGCTKLATFSYPTSLKSIGVYAFQDCSKLPDCTLPDSVTTIGYGAFNGCTSIKTVRIPASLTTLAEGQTANTVGVFQGCTSLTTVIGYYNSSLKTIPANMFNGCSSLSSITFPLGIETIEDKAFYSCGSLSSIVIPGSIKSIGTASFCDCPALKDVKIAATTAPSVVYGSRTDNSKNSFMRTKVTFTYPNGASGYTSGSWANYPNKKAGTVVVPTPPSATPTPEPTTVTPKPTVVTPKPTVVTPKPTVVTPKPTVVTPKPTVVTPKPTVVTPKPTVVTPKPTVVTPKPTVVTPKPTVVTPKPTVVTPKPTVVTPKPTVVTPEPTVVTPKPTVVTPEPSVSPSPNAKPTVTTAPTATAKPTATSTPIPTRKPTATATPTKRPTAVPTRKPTSTPKPTATPVPSTGSSSSAQGLGAFIERLYSVALGRPSEAYGKSYWINKVKNEGFTGADVARGFLFSDEFLNKNMSNSDFLDTLYMTFFNRPADAEKANWLNLMNKGWTKMQVINGFINSTEWANLCLNYGIASGTNCKPNIVIQPSAEVESFARRLYTTCLGRNADANGLRDWATRLANMQISGSEAAHGFFFSSEFTASNISNDEYVKRLYRTFMGREYDQGGYDYWIGQLAAGKTREEVFQGFAGSAEWAGICAEYGILK